MSAVRLLAAAVWLQGLSGVFGGLALVIDPSGALISLPLSMLDGTPFADFRVPGLILLTVLGVGPLAVGWGIARRAAWAWVGAMLVGAALTVWIVVEIAMVGYQSEPPLQAMYGALAAVILVLGVLPSVRRELRPGPGGS